MILFPERSNSLILSDKPFNRSILLKFLFDKSRLPSSPLNAANSSWVISPSLFVSAPASINASTRVWFASFLSYPFHPFSKDVNVISAFIYLSSLPLSDSDPITDTKAAAVCILLRSLMLIVYSYAS